MAKCPVCETNVTQHWFRGFLVALFLGILIGFIGGQLFHKWQYGDMWKDRSQRLEIANEELRKGYVPPKPILPQEKKK